MGSCLLGTLGQGAVSGKDPPVSDGSNSYLPGRGDTMIKKVVHPVALLFPSFVQKLHGTTNL